MLNSRILLNSTLCCDTGPINVALPHDTSLKKGFGGEHLSHISSYSYYPHDWQVSVFVADPAGIPPSCQRPNVPMSQDLHVHSVP